MDNTLPENNLNNNYDSDSESDTDSDNNNNESITFTPNKLLRGLQVTKMVPRDVGNQKHHTKDTPMNKIKIPG